MPRELSSAAERRARAHWDANELNSRVEKLAFDLEAERSHSRQLLESFPTGCVVTDLGGAIQDANGFFSDLVGIQARFLAGKPLAALVEPGERRALRNLIASMRDHGAAAQLGVGLARRRGDTREARLTALPATEGAPCDRIVWLVEPVGSEARPRLPSIDETVRSRTSELATALRRYEEQMRTLEAAFRQLPVCAVLVRAHDGPPVTTAALDRLLGDPLPALAAARAPDGHEIGASELPFVRSLTHGEIVRSERLVVDGERDALLRLECGAEPIRSPAGHIVGAIGVVVDLDAETRQLSLERDFLAAAAHQLQNPLTAIATAVEVLQSGAKNVPDERDRFLDHIEESASRLTRVVRSLIVLLRQRTRTETPRRRVVPVAPLLRTVAARVDPAGLRVSVEGSDAVSVLAEPTLVEQALENLATNAVRHGVGSVRLVCGGIEDGKATIAICDSGPGLPDDVLARIQTSTAPLGHALSGSVGLGLAIAIQIVHVLDGELTATSGKEGSTLTIRLPAGRRLAP
jgi:PAS domain S-box-containing protein